VSLIPALLPLSVGSYDRSDLSGHP
jgi:hypothetical protein